MQEEAVKMKKFIPILAGLFLLIGVMSGCGENQNPVPQSDAQSTAQATQTPSAQPDIQQAQTPDQNNTDETVNRISEEKAKEIALSKAGITAEGVTFEKIELDNDDGVRKYEIEFRQGNTEYDVDIKADDGTVLKFEKDIAD